MFDFQGNWSRAGSAEPLTLRSSTGPFEVHVERPLEAGPARVVILLDGEMRAELAARSKAEHFAFDGFLAFAPDLAHRLPPVRPLRASYAGLCEHGWDPEGALLDLVDLIKIAREVRSGDGQVAVVGWGVGGQLALLLARLGLVDAAVIYGDVEVGERLTRPDVLACPVLIHLDARAPSWALELERRLDDHQWIQVELDLDIDHRPREATSTTPVLADLMTSRFLTRSLRRLDAR